MHFEPVLEKIFIWLDTSNPHFHFYWSSFVLMFLCKCWRAESLRTKAQPLHCVKCWTRIILLLKKHDSGMLLLNKTKYRWLKTQDIASLWIHKKTFLITNFIEGTKYALDTQFLKISSYKPKRIIEWYIYASVHCNTHCLLIISDNIQYVLDTYAVRWNISTKICHFQWKILLSYHVMENCHNN